jgi:hypothetical protein
MPEAVHLLRRRVVPETSLVLRLSAPDTQNTHECVGGYKNRLQANFEFGWNFLLAGFFKARVDLAGRDAEVRFRFLDYRIPLHAGSRPLFDKLGDKLPPILSQ